MNAEMKRRFTCALDDKTESLTQTIGALAASGRKDEANLQKAARNIYGIFLSLLQKSAGDGDIERLFHTLPDAWHAARSLAIEHGDFVRTAVEDIKLATLDDIRALYAHAALAASTAETAHCKREVCAND